MRIVFASAEASPFAKVGGLGDVVGSLPKALASLGDEVIVCLPLYGSITRDEYDLFETGIQVQVSHYDQVYPVTLLESTLPGSNVKIYFLSNDELFGRIPEVYPEGNPQLDALRYAVFTRGIFLFLKEIQWQPDIYHVHDWHTSNLAVWLKTEVSQDPFFASAASVLSIHNMAYQGDVDGTNWLKEGIIYSDALIAVSPTYAKEILTDQGGAGLEGVVQSQRHKLYGILNGIDTGFFNPETDRFIAKRYDTQSVNAGKAACKQSVQLEMGLPETAEIPLFGMVTRLVEQKGLDLLIPILHQLKDLPAQFAILGNGQHEYEDALRAMNTKSSNIRSMIGFNMALGQQIYAGSDLFLMPSRFEPCGLGQMIALRYGSLPLVRKTGGLADTVFDIAREQDKANGFMFEPYDSQALLDTIHRAIACWQQRDNQWATMVKRGMTADMSWQQSARAYQEVYRTVHQRILQRT